MRDNFDEAFSMAVERVAAERGISMSAEQRALCRRVAELLEPVDTRELAAMLGVSLRRVQHILGADRLASIRVGREWAVYRVAAEDFAAQDRPAGRRPKD